MYRITTRLILVAVLLSAAPYAALASPADDQFLVAANHYRRARWELAREEFQTFLAQHADDPRSGDARFFLAEALVQLGDYPRAREAFEDLLARHPQHRFQAQVVFRLGEANYLLGDHATARQHLERFQAEHPQHALNAYALPYLGEIALEAGDARQAEQWFADSLRRQPQGALAHAARFGIGRCLELQGDPDGAIRFYQFLVEQPDNALADDAQLRTAVVHYQAQRYDEALAILQSWPTTFPDSSLRADSLYWLAMVHSQRGQWAEAITTLEAAAQAGNERLQPAIHFAWGEALRQSGETLAAWGHYEQVYTEWPDSPWGDDSLQAAAQLALELDNAQHVLELAETFSQRYANSSLRPIVEQTRGRALLKLEQYERAAEAFSELPPPTSPLRAAQHYYRALALLGTGQYEATLAELEQLAALQPGDPLLLASRAAQGAALVGLQRYEQAIAPLRDYLDSAPSGGDTARSRAQLVLALASVQRIEDAQQELDRLAVEQPDSELLCSTLVFLAGKAHEQQRAELAESLYLRLLEQQSGPQHRADARQNLARMYLARGENARALEQLQRLIAEHSDDPRGPAWQLLLAQTYQRLKQPEAAIQEYQQIAERHPHSTEAPLALLEAARLHTQAQRHQEAASLLEPLVKNYPQFPLRSAALYEWAWTLADLGQQETADNVFEQLRQEYPASRFWADATYRLAERAARAGQHARAAALADELVQRECGGELVMHAFYLQGQLAAAEQRWADVAPPLEALLQQFPQTSLAPAARFWIAEAHYRLEQWEPARKAFDRLATETAGNESWRAIVLLRQAQLLAQDRQWNESLELARSIQLKFPQFDRQYEADYLIGRCFAAKALFQEAREAYQRVLDSPTGSRTETAAMAAWMIGETYLFQQQYEAAIRAYHRVEALYPYPQWQAAALLQAAKCHEQQRRWSTAMQLYQQLLTDYPQSSLVAEARQRLETARQAAKTAASLSTPQRN